MSFIKGKALRFDGVRVDNVIIFDWDSGKFRDIIKPDINGYWEYEYFDRLECGIMYTAIGCKSITQGKYVFVGDEWNPSIYFTGGGQGAWYDPSDTSTLFQDVGGNVPVTANNQRVSLMLDKSGNGNNMIQRNSLKRPLYQTDGILHWLVFDSYYEEYLITESSLRLKTPVLQTVSALVETRNNSKPYQSIQGTGFLANSVGFGVYYNNEIKRWQSQLRILSAIASLSTDEVHDDTKPVLLTNFFGINKLIYIHNKKEKSVSHQLGSVKSEHELSIGSQHTGAHNINMKYYGSVIAEVEDDIYFYRGFNQYYNIKSGAI